MTFRRAQTEVLHQSAAALFEHAIESGTEAIAIERVQHIEPARRRPFERAALQAQQLLRLRAGVDAVRRHVPVPDHVAGARERQRAPLDIGDDVMGDASGEGVLHDGEADQHDDQDETAEQRRTDDVVGDIARDRHHQTDGPDHQQKPGRDQQHGPVVAVGGEIDHEAQSEERDQDERKPRNAGGDRGIDQRDHHERRKAREPGQRDVHVAHVPARKIEIGEQEHQQRAGQDCLARGTPDALGARRHVEHLAPEAEVDADVDQHRPAERRGRRKHHAALDHEQDGQEQCQQSGDADDDAVVERKAVDLVLVGVGLPQVELRQPVGAQLCDVGDDRAWIERDAVDVGGGAVLLLRPLARARRDGDDAGQAEVGQEQSGSDHAVMRHHDKSVDLLVAGIGESEHRPVGRTLTCRLLHAAHDAVGAGGGRHRDGIAIGLDQFGDAGEVDCGHVGADVHRLDGMGGRRAKDGGQQQCREWCGAQQAQTTTSAAILCVPPKPILGPRLKPLTIRPFRDPSRSRSGRAGTSRAWR